MTARPPPARPHIGLNPATSTRFSSYATVEWAEDDAWDSASDSESAIPSSSAKQTPARAATADFSIPARHAPKQTRSPSAGSIAFSYTHVSAPSPGSYTDNSVISNAQDSPSKASWAMVNRLAQQQNGIPQLGNEGSSKSTSLAEEFVVEDVIVSDMEGMGLDTKSSKPRAGRESVKLDAQDIVQDPLHIVRKRREALRAEAQRAEVAPFEYTNHGSSQSMREQSIKANRQNKFINCLMADDVSVVELCKLAWSGIPDELRPIAWQFLLGYIPSPAPLRVTTLSRKREEYASLVELAFARGREGLDQQVWHQIEIDVPRTRPGVKLWMFESTQRSIERILYVWAIRHPASGYVQGINDLVTPFFQVFLSAYITTDPEDFDPGNLPPSALSAIEADSFWCLSRLLDGIQDNYISAQPGIQRSVKRMAELVSRIDSQLTTHLQSENVEFMQFAFRWMNCLLMRELSVKNTIRMWDAYLSEGSEAFSQFHLYVCSAFLMRWSKNLKEMDFQGIIMFLQSLPTQEWSEKQIEELLSEAFVLSQTWHNAQSHFHNS